MRLGDVLDAFEDQPDQHALLRYHFHTLSWSHTDQFSSRVKTWLTFQGRIPYGNLSRIDMEFIWPGMTNREGSLKTWSSLISPVSMKNLSLGCITYSRLTSAEEIPTRPPKCIKKIKFRLFSQEVELISGALCQAFKRDTLYASGAYRNELEASTRVGDISKFILYLWCSSLHLIPGYRDIVTDRRNKKLNDAPYANDFSMHLISFTLN